LPDSLSGTNRANNIVVPVIAGIHPIREALLAGQTFERVLIAKGAGGPKVQEIVDLCKQKKVPLRYEERGVLDKASGSVPHQGVLAIGADLGYATFDAAEGKPLVVILDGIEDPHNLGAIIRTAHAAGAGAVVIPERRAAGLTETVAKASAGAIAYMPVIRVVNISHSIDDFKKRGYWIYGLDERGEQTYDQVEYTRPTAIVLGGEGKGLHEHVKKRCDFLLKIPMAGAIASLNVSVAAGVVLFEWRKQGGAVESE
jgi:23S rRNA (guanosine2251-2'-O)-methyltransferase